MRTHTRPETQSNKTTIKPNLICFQYKTKQPKLTLKHIHQYIKSFNFPIKHDETQQNKIKQSKTYF